MDVPLREQAALGKEEGSTWMMKALGMRLVWCFDERLWATAKEVWNTEGYEENRARGEHHRKKRECRILADE